jgi:hypothetical protein
MEMMMARPTAASAAATVSTKKTSTWAVEVAPGPAEGDEGEVDGVEHELHTHEHGDDVAPHQDADHADGEEGEAQEERVLKDGGGSRVGVPLGQRDGADEGSQDQDRGGFEHVQVVLLKSRSATARADASKAAATGVRTATSTDPTSPAGRPEGDRHQLGDAPLAFRALLRLDVQGASARTGRGP